MRVVIFGGRDFTNKSVVFRALDLLHKDYNFSTVIEGEAPGVDRLAGAWAESKSIPVEKYPANWSRYGRAAGPIRNKQMIDEGKPDMGIAFPGGTGTLNMKNQLINAGIEFKTIVTKDKKGI